MENMTIGEKIKMLRLERGMTQEVLAEQIGLKRVTSVSIWENGHGRPNAYFTYRLAQALGVSVDELMDVGDA